MAPDCELFPLSAPATRNFGPLPNLWAAAGISPLFKGGGHVDSYAAVVAWVTENLWGRMSSMPFQNFQTLDVTRFRQTLAKLHEAVGCGNGRVEVVRKGCADVCVLISKAELESLEQALEILAQ